jgi:hypothetical protein
MYVKSNEFRMIQWRNNTSYNIISWNDMLDRLAFQFRISAILDSILGPKAGCFEPFVVFLRPSVQIMGHALNMYDSLSS